MLGSVLTSSADRGLPVVVSVPVPTRDAGMAVGAWLVDPGLVWFDGDDGRRCVLSAVLALRVSVRAHADVDPSERTHVERRLSRVDIAPIVDFASARKESQGDRSSLWGRHLGLVTRWPMAAGTTASPEAPTVAMPARIAPGPAVFLRDDRDEPAMFG